MRGNPRAVRLRLLVTGWTPLNLKPEPKNPSAGVWEEGVPSGGSPLLQASSLPASRAVMNPFPQLKGCGCVQGPRLPPRCFSCSDEREPWVWTWAPLFPACSSSVYRPPGRAQCAAMWADPNIRGALGCCPCEESEGLMRYHEPLWLGCSDKKVRQPLYPSLRC